MVFIMIEDSTSGYDFINTIVKRVIKPTKDYIVLSLFGSGGIKSFVENIENFRFIEDKTTGVQYNVNTSMDSVVLFLDMVTEYNSLLLKIEDIVKIFYIDYFCFEEILFNYDFKNRVVGDFKFLSEFCTFKSMLLSRDFRTYGDFLRRNMEVLKVGYCTPEQLATRVFIYFYRFTPCVIVNKNAYKCSLDEALSQKVVGKAYYNNLCNRGELMHYCTNCKKHKKCKAEISLTTRGSSANLSDLYYTSILSKPLCMVGGSNIDITLHKLLR